jgi:hypothetical protein
MLVCFSELFSSCLLAFQRECTGGPMDHGLKSPPANVFRSVIPSPPHSPCRCTKYLSRISDLEGHLSLMKRQAKTATDQASKSYGLMKQVSILEDKVSSLVAQVTHLKECDSFLVDFVMSACEQLKCRFPAYFLEIIAATFVSGFFDDFAPSGYLLTSC